MLSAKRRLLTAECGALPFCPIGINQNLTRRPRLQSLHCLGKVLHSDPIRNHGMQIQFSALEQSRHLIPGLVHPTSANALNSDSLKNNVFGEIKRNWFGGKPEQRNSSTAPDNIE